MGLIGYIIIGTVALGVYFNFIAPSEDVREPQQIETEKD